MFDSRKGEVWQQRIQRRGGQNQVKSHMQKVEGQGESRGRVFGKSEE